MSTCDDQTRAARLTAALDDELSLAATGQFDASGLLWWLSFVDPATDLPLDEQAPGKGSAFLGVTVVAAIGPTHALSMAHALGANPGGDVQISAVPEEYVPLEYRDRLLSREDLAELGAL